MFPLENHFMKLKERRLIKVDMPFVEEKLGLTLVKLFISVTIITLRERISRNRAMLNVVNASDTKISLSPNKAIGLICARTLGYYKIDHKASQQSLTNYQFVGLHKLYGQLIDYVYER